MEKYSTQIIDILITYAPKVVGAIVTLVIGLWLIKIIVKTVRKTMERRKVDASLIPFLSTVFSVLLKILLFLSVVSMVGVEATSFIAILGAAGLAIGLSLQGTLQNFAGGVVLLLLKPFKIGDVVDAKGFLGVVKEIQIFYTIVNTFDNKVIYLPNGSLANSDMTNLSQEEDRRNEWTFGIGYGDDVAKAKKIIRRLIDEDKRIFQDPEPFLALHSLGDSSVNIVVRTWSKASDLWPVYFEMNEKVYNEFAKEGINIPFPQMDVHLHKQDK
ncbi:mechanosensitive ion channel family protein [Flavobacteriaceae bacterium 14752]|uniref:mechanosensitive ion channel family protein n=1 Tax=Mesohalobacter salilacus TaxID=2491711 RepID=UPI000F633198|nr:mechanosensitive ion channel [Flavobacteriaceae bacterium 14752]